MNFDVKYEHSICSPGHEVHDPEVPRRGDPEYAPLHPSCQSVVMHMQTGTVCIPAEMQGILYLQRFHNVTLPNILHSQQFI
jgi:hypothetical protein